MPSEASIRVLRGGTRALALGAMLVWLLLAPSALAGTSASSTTGTGTGTAGGGTPTGKPPAVASLEECVTAPTQSERSATFSGEMSAIPGATKMEMRIDVLERQPREAIFHTVSAPGLGVWRTAASGVKTYRYLKQVTNLAAPAWYRAAVRFRWLNSKGKLVKAQELRTQRCLQTVQAGTETGGETPPLATG